MIAQYTQAALVNECQVLAHPAGAGSVPTSAGMEDFNSMGAWAALKARQIVDCAAHVVAIELVCACQGIEFHRPLQTHARRSRRRSPRCASASRGSSRTARSRPRSSRSRTRCAAASSCSRLATHAGLAARQRRLDSDASSARRSACSLREDGDGLLLDAGTGLRRLVSEPELLDGVRTLDIVLTHFHLDHVCGLAYVPALPLTPTIWAPGRWLYGQASAELLAPLRTAPISPSDASELGEVRELGPGAQAVGRFRGDGARAAAALGADRRDPRRRRLALITDTAYDPQSADFARDVTHLLHEAWSSSANPVAQAGDSTAAEAGRSRARRARSISRSCTSARCSPTRSELLADARAHFPERATRARSPAAPSSIARAPRSRRDRRSGRRVWRGRARA